MAMGAGQELVYTAFCEACQCHGQECHLIPSLASVPRLGHDQPSFDVKF
jgi:hypothetical protein